MVRRGNCQANTGKISMAVLGVTLCAVFMVTAVTSKPVSLNEGEDSSESSESSSSEETANHVGPSQEPQQPTFTETDMPNAMEETNPLDTAALPSADAGPSPATLNTSALPDPEDPQTSANTDTLQLMPGDPPQTTLGGDISQVMLDSDPVQDPLNADTAHVRPDTEASLHPRLPATDIIIGTGQPHVTTTYQGFPQGASPPFPPHVIKPTPLSFSTTQRLPIPIGTALTGVPVCFTFQLVTPEPGPPRGDSI